MDAWCWVALLKFFDGLRQFLQLGVCPTDVLNERSKGASFLFYVVNLLFDVVGVEGLSVHAPIVWKTD
ncbi:MULTISPECIES: hypothetical protein [Deinococcus]|uniref:hypothetical protein n=1 Tax=Deinococcus TaxID=1298 RepID=UPI00166C513B|nr:MULTISPECIES: hypothetical protein [Deinococcus]MDK2014018.1 hypothetical protein [Deinococcus sp. 43]GGB83069.1 hypothetical protein GCM10008019_43990 [Deinococcus soli (ex Cha et al. 2016)]